jgi:O-antigen ligase
MVEKTLIIFDEHSLTGIGLNNFTNYDVYFEGNFEGSQFVVNKDGTNDKSAHNSYASILAEGGLLLFIPLALLLLFNIIHFFKSFTKRSQMENAFYWSFLGMCIHLYFISAILNVFAWFLIGIVTALSVKSQRGELNRFSSF